MVRQCAVLRPSINVSSSYAEQPKYKCPRCKTQTCSLPCYKRHQQRASCNGQRNPAEFVKKSQWATPDGIDRDYNYLKSVERNIERADDSLKPLLSNKQSKNSRQLHQSESKLYRYLQQNNITILRAPLGMSKSKANKTRVAQSGKVFWTVAWIDSTGNTFIDEDCPEAIKLADLHVSATKKRTRNARPRPSADADELTPKRVRLEEPSEQQQHASDNSVAASTSTISAKSVDDETQSDKPQPGSTKGATAHFYLLRPGGSDVKVLIPLQAHQDLTAALRGHTVQEFPSIYALPYASEVLPAEFILEETFLAKHKPGAGDEEAAEQTDMPVFKSEPTAEQILEMLRRDVRTT
ncbi:hypothetical protein AMS68_004625 [Peltaster fructicola]|uniref:HIT-type domain-containing protein n=1 Tax=Peltaster fructicola TaxID=286661 RepID=A0A6H0XWY4_9PEZI|nr:hypothetical protein AMS68_004625 [Peltaster fructicola]